MKRPDFVTNEDIDRWSKIIDEDPSFPKEYKDLSILKEVCYAGCWLSESLTALQCPEELIFRIQWTAGRLSFGRDPWEIHQNMFNDYVNNDLTFEEECLNPN